MNQWQPQGYLYYISDVIKETESGKYRTTDLIAVKIYLHTSTDRTLTLYNLKYIWMTYRIEEKLSTFDETGDKEDFTKTKSK